MRQYWCRSVRSEVARDPSECSVVSEGPTRGLWDSCSISQLFCHSATTYSATWAAVMAYSSAVSREHTLSLRSLQHQSKTRHSA